MRLHVADHPLVAHKLTVLRDERHRLADLPPARRRAGHPARLRGDPRRARRAVRDRAPRSRPRRASHLTTRRPGGADPARRAGHARRDGPAAADRRGRLPRAWCATRRPSRRSPTPTGCPTTCPGGSATCSTRCWPPAGRWSAAIDYLVERGADGHHRDLPARGARGHPASRTTSATAPAVTVVTGGGRRAAQREGLHRPGPRRRGRPALRRRLTPRRTAARRIGRHPATASTASPGRANCDKPGRPGLSQHL